MSEIFEVTSKKLYAQSKSTAKFYKSRAYRLTRIISMIVRQPVGFAKRGARLVARNPKKAVDIALGKKQINSLTQDQSKLSKDYNDWLNVTEESAGKDVKKGPLISLITPVFDPPPAALRELVDSVLGQTYGHLELLLYNFGTDPAIKKLINSYAKKDKRVVMKHGLPNKGIGENSNLCFEDVTGDFVALLDHDDALVLSALEECVRVINKTGADFVYSDKDKVTEDGTRFEPLFKPDWSPEMALGGNYMTHLNLMRTKLVKSLGGWDPSTDGAQDWDLFLRITEKTDKIAHVPKILYHWRTVAGSTANGIANKPYAMAAQVKAVSKHLAALGVDSAVPFHDPYGQLYISWSQNNISDTVFIIHAHYWDQDNIKKLVSIVEAAGATKKQIHLVGYDSSLNSEVGNVQSHAIKRGELAQTVSDIAKKSKAKRVVYLKDSLVDVYTEKTESNWINQLTGWLSIPGVTIAGGAQYSRQGHLLDIGSFFDSPTSQFHKFYFASEHRSGYIGPKEWIRNFVLVSEGIFAFTAEAVDELLLKSQSVPDHEFAKALALSNYRQGRRAVYDPLVCATDEATFELSTPLSEATKSRISDQLSGGDPYYNRQLDDNYVDPTPVSNGAGRHNTELVLNLLDR